MMVKTNQPDPQTRDIRHSHAQGVDRFKARAQFSQAITGPRRRLSRHPKRGHSFDRTLQPSKFLV